jgi:signal transduction histidine kinase
VTDEKQINRLRHDLRTPLTVVIGFAELLASNRELTDDQRRDYASRVLGAGVEMRELIDSDRLDGLRDDG